MEEAMQRMSASFRARVTLLALALLCSSQGQGPRAYLTDYSKYQVATLGYFSYPTSDFLSLQPPNNILHLHHHHPLVLPIQVLG